MKDYHYLILVFCLLTVLIGVLYKYPDLIWKFITVFVPDSWPVQPVSLSSTEAHETYKVDAVFTWVDSSDPEWKRSKHRRLHGSVDSKPTDNDLNRWTDPDCPEAEIELSLELLLKNAPWINRIYILTARAQSPKCLVTNPNIAKESDKIEVVHHDQIWEDPSGGLPVFNSHAIESQLHRIPGLQERFLYLNDDVFIVKPVTRANWFIDGKPILQPHRYQFYRLNIPDTILKHNTRGGGWPHQKAWKNLIKLLSHRPIYVNTEQPQSLTKSVLENALDNNTENKVIATKNSPFRSEKDIPPVGYSLNKGVSNGTVVLGKSNANKTQSLCDVSNTPIHPDTTFVCINVADHIDREVETLRKKLGIM